MVVNEQNTCASVTAANTNYFYRRLIDKSFGLYNVRKLWKMSIPVLRSYQTSWPEKHRHSAPYGIKQRKSENIHIWEAENSLLCHFCQKIFWLFVLDEHSGQWSFRPIDRSINHLIDQSTNCCKSCICEEVKNGRHFFQISFELELKWMINSLVAW